MQAENEWFCHNQEQADKYLREIVRYLLENGCEVPIINCNKLWQRIEGTIDTWNANQDLLAHLRSSAVVQPEAPRLVSEYWSGGSDRWGHTHETNVSADLYLNRLSQILAAGSQYNLYMLHGGTNFGFNGGRIAQFGDDFQTTSYDYDAPLLEAGGRGEKYDATKRISTFATQFHYVFSHLEPASPHATFALHEGDTHPPSIVHQSGTQGEVLFIFKSDSDKRRHAEILLPDGVTLNVPMAAKERLAWCMRNTNLGGVAHLNHTNLRPWAFLNKQMLVLFGPAEAEGVVTLNDTSLQMKVPSGKEPHVEMHDELTIVVLNDDQLDATYIDDDGIVIGAAGIDAEGNAIARQGWPRAYRVALDGNITKKQLSGPARSTAPRLGNWQQASLHAILDGSDPAYEKIDGPVSLEDKGCDYGYGWYRIGMGNTKEARVLAPQAGDRLHVYSDGKLQGIVGRAPGAKNEPMSMRLGGDVVVLADNLGRPDRHFYAQQSKGLFGHLYAVKAASLNKPTIDRGRVPDPFAVSGYIPCHRRGEDGSAADSVTWTLKPSGKKPYVLEISGLPTAAVVSISMTSPSTTSMR